jgi:uncharacterized protein YjiS (DUF1127 family)
MTRPTIGVPRILALLCLRSRKASGSPSGERFIRRAIRWLADRKCLAEADDRQLADIGLTRADVTFGTPFGGRLPNDGMSRSAKAGDQDLQLIEYNQAC